MKTITISCQTCGNVGLIAIGPPDLGVTVPCPCQDPRDPNSHHHKPLDCSACDGSGRTKRGSRCRTCGGSGRIARGE